MKNHTEAQWKQILAYMKTGRSITGYTALVKFDSMRLAGRIRDIKDAGYEVGDKFIKLSNGKRVKKYFIPGVYEGD